VAAVLSNPRSRNAKLLTVGQVAALLSISVRQVWYLAKRGDLSPVYVGSRTRWQRKDVTRYRNRISVPRRAKEVVRA
jgi:excisionase family DNA binding protein